MIGSLLKKVDRLRMLTDGIKRLEALTSDSSLQRLQGDLENIHNSVSKLKMEVAHIHQEREIGLMFVIGFARSGTTVAMRILNSADDVFLLAEYNSHLMQSKANPTKDFTERKQAQTAANMLGKGYVAPFLRDVTTPASLFSQMSSKFSGYGEKIAVGMGTVNGRNEIWHLKSMLDDFPNAFMLFTARKPTENMASVAKMFPERTAKEIVTMQAAALAFVLRAYFCYPRTHLLFAEDCGPQVISELSQMIGTHCNLPADEVGEQRVSTRGLEGCAQRFDLTQVERLDRAYSKIRKLFEAEGTSVKSLKSEKLMWEIAPVIADLEALALQLSGGDTSLTPLAPVQKASAV